MSSKELVTILKGIALHSQQITIQVGKALQLCSKDDTEIIIAEDDSVPCIQSDLYRITASSLSPKTTIVPVDLVTKKRGLTEAITQEIEASTAKRPRQDVHVNYPVDLSETVAPLNLFMKSSAEKSNNKSATSHCSNEEVLDLSEINFLSHGKQTLRDANQTDVSSINKTEEQGSHMMASLARFTDADDIPDVTIPTINDARLNSSDSNLHDKATTNYLIRSDTTCSSSAQPKEKVNGDFNFLSEGTSNGSKQILITDHRMSNCVNSKRDEVGEQKKNNNNDDNTHSDENTNTYKSVGTMIEDYNRHEEAACQDKLRLAEVNLNVDSEGSVREAESVSILPSNMNGSDTRGIGVINLNDTNARDETNNVSKMFIEIENDLSSLYRFTQREQTQAPSGANRFTQDDMGSFTPEQSPQRKENHFLHEVSTHTSSFDSSERWNVAASRSTTIVETLGITSKSANTTLIMDDDNSLSKASIDRITDWMGSVATNHSDTLSELALLLDVIFPPDTRAIELQSSFVDTASDCGAEDNILLDENTLIPSFIFADQIPDAQLAISDARIESLATESQTEPEKNKSAEEEFIRRLAQSTPLTSKPIFNTNQIRSKDTDLVRIRQAIVSAILETHLAKEVSNSLESTTSTNRTACSKENENLSKLHVPLENGWKRETVILSITSFQIQIQGNVCYYAPGSQAKLENVEQIQTVLEQQSSDLTTENFSFSARHIVGSFLQPQPYSRNTDEEFIRITDTEVAKRLVLFTKRCVNVADEEGDQAENSHIDNRANRDEQLESMSVRCVIENIVQEPSSKEGSDNVPLNEENNVLENGGLDLDTENYNDENLCDTENSDEKHLSTTTVCVENFNSAFTQKPLKKVKRNHKVRKFHICHICEKQLQRKSNLVNHLKMHYGVRPYSCTECRKSFVQRHHLTAPMMIHSGEKPYGCTECTKSFRCQSSLSYHMKIHRGEKSYNCTECSKSFRQGSHLTAHLKIHTQTIIFSCYYCGQNYFKKKDLRDHCLKCYKSQKVGDSTESSD